MEGWGGGGWGGGGGGGGLWGGGGSRHSHWSTPLAMVEGGVIMLKNKSQNIGTSLHLLT